MHGFNTVLQTVVKWEQTSSISDDLIPLPFVQFYKLSCLKQRKFSQSLPPHTRCLLIDPNTEGQEMKKM
jgi:hypothetical protein